MPRNTKKLFGVSINNNPSFFNNWNTLFKVLIGSIIFSNQ